MSTDWKNDYDYNPATGTYVKRDPYARSSRQHHHAPPPIPPKEVDARVSDDYVVSPIKETQHGIAAELEGDIDVGRLSLEEKPAPAPAVKQKRRPSRVRKKIRVLSLDGGGIRGYSTLLILQELMHQVYVQSHGGKAPKSSSELPRPCDYFDIIGGNGTGGLIALMLGRMRMDVESCKRYYVELTRFVFITDKTLMGVPYGKTLFKASRLEEAIRHCVRESTRFDADKIIPHSPPPDENEPAPHQMLHRRRTDSWRRHNNRPDSEDRGRSGYPRTRRGNADAPLADPREGACKTFVTAMLEGSGQGASPILLRSYPSPADSGTSYKTTIWQAGRATCATAAAFKPITIDQITFLDEGGGQYNPAFQMLDEARNNEYPHDELSVFVSVGTGKRLKKNASEDRAPWWEGVIATPFDNFTEARKRLMRRIDDCEHVHRELVDGIDGGRPRLAKSGVATEDYYRFNVEVGVGEFGMNEWNRLAEVSTGTKRYLAMRETSKLVRECAGKMVAIEQRHEEYGTKTKFRPSGYKRPEPSVPENGSVAELSAESADEEAVDVPNPHPNPQQWAPRPQQSQPIPYDARKRQSYPPKIQQQQSIPQIAVQQPQQQQEVIDMPYMPDMDARDNQAPSRPAKVVLPGGQGYYADDHPNPEIRITSPTTVAGDSDDEMLDGEMYPGFGRVKKGGRRRSGSGRRRGRNLQEVIE